MRINDKPKSVLAPYAGPLLAPYNPGGNINAASLTLSGNLVVGGTSTLTGSTSASTISVSGLSTLTSISASGTSSLGATTTGILTASTISATSVALSGLLDLSAAGAGQIQFPAAQNPSSNANTFDDCERGTFTVILRGSSTAGTQTYSAQAASYMKLARKVHAQGTLAIGTKDATTAGSLQILTLPFTSDATTNLGAGMTLGYTQQLVTNTAGNFFTTTASLGANAILVQLYETGNNVLPTNLAAADFTNGSAFNFSLEYMATT